MDYSRIIFNFIFFMQKKGAVMDSAVGADKNNLF